MSQGLCAQGRAAANTLGSSQSSQNTWTTCVSRSRMYCTHAHLFTFAGWQHASSVAACKKANSLCSPPQLNHPINKSRMFQAVEEEPDDLSTKYYKHVTHMSTFVTHMTWMKHLTFVTRDKNVNHATTHMLHILSKCFVWACYCSWTWSVSWSSLWLW